MTCAFAMMFPLTKIDRFKLRKIANGLAQKFSHGVVAKFVTWSRAVPSFNCAMGLYGGRSQDRTVDLLLVRQAL